MRVGCRSLAYSCQIILLSQLNIEKFVLMASLRPVASINFMLTQRRQLILTDEHIDDLRDMTNSNLCTLESDCSPLRDDEWILFTSKLVHDPADRSCSANTFTETFRHDRGFCVVRHFQRKNDLSKKKKNKHLCLSWY